MQEGMTYTESLQALLAIRESLQRVTKPVDIIAVVAEAIAHIEQWERPDDPPLLMETIDLLCIIQGRVRVRYSAIVIPRAYREWWQAAQAEIDEQAQHYREILRTLQTMPADTPDERRTVRERQFHVSIGAVSHETFIASIDDPTAFAAWRRQMEEMINELLTACAQTRNLLAENAPVEMA